jgi:hypothetical protein
LQQILAAAEVDRLAIQDRLTQSTALLAEIQAQQRESSSIATLSIAAKTQISDSQAVIAAKSDHIQNAQEHADKVRADLDRALTAAQGQLTEIEGNKDRAKVAADLATDLQVALAASKAASEADMAVVKQSLAGSLADAIRTKKLADKSTDIEVRIASYEDRLAEFERNATSQLQAIVELLPGATSAGLASAFDKRRTTFLEPGKRWQWIFVGSLALLAILALSGLIQVYASGVTLSYGELFRLWLSRLPIAGALVWLALHASREASLAKRLEEDYGYKSAIASSFQGFQHQMREIDAAAGASSPLGKLCEDTLFTLASPPGRIYEKHPLSISPTTEIAAAAKAAVDAVLARKTG